MSDQLELKEQKRGFFNFKQHAEVNQKVEGQPVYDDALAYAQNRYEEATKERKRLGKISVAKWEEDEARLNNLGKGELFVDRSGTAIPYEEKKKLGLFKVTESEEHYKERIRNQIVNRHKDYTLETAFVTNDASNLVEHFENAGVVTRVDLSQIQDNFSEKRRSMQKQAITKMAEEDLKRKFAEDGSEKEYKEFLETVEQFGKEEGKSYLVHEITMDEDGITKNVVSRDKEISLYNEAMTKLENLMSKEGLSNDIYMTLDGYHRLLKTMAEGDLNTKNIKKEDVSEVTSAIIYDDEKKDVVKEVPDAVLFAHEPSLSDIAQGRIGDCYLLATLTSIVSVEPQNIKNSMKDNGDGTVTVRFFRTGFKQEDLLKEGNGPEYDSKPTYVTVPKVEITKRGGKLALWVNVMEIAYAEFNRQKEVRKKSVDSFLSSLPKAERNELKRFAESVKADINRQKEKHFKDATKDDTREAEFWTYINRMEDKIKESGHWDEYKAILEEKKEKVQGKKLDLEDIVGGRETWVFSALSGKVHNTKRYERPKAQRMAEGTGTSFSGEYSDDQKKLFESIQNALSSRKCVTFGTAHIGKDGKEISIMGGAEHTFDGISSGHAYTIIGTKTQVINGKEMKFIRARNPWGSCYTSYHDAGNGRVAIEQRKDSALNGITEIELEHFMHRMDALTITDNIAGIA